MINVECKGEKLVKKKRYIIQTVVLGIVAWISCFIFAININAKTEIEEPIGVYSVQDFPYKSDSVAKESLDKMKEMDNFVYVKKVVHLASSASFKQTSDQTEYIYYGKLKKGYPDGCGVILEKNKGYYIVRQMGEFKKGRLNGYGYQFKVGTIYSNLSQYQGGDSLFLSYEGNFQNGVPNGKGTSYAHSNSLDDQVIEYEEYINSADGDSYVTEDYEEILLQYPIALSYKLYEGDYKKGLYSGKGTIYFQGFKDYEGEFKNDKKNGKGKEYYEGTTILRYEGSYKNNLYHGKGKLYNENGELKYKGTFKKGNYD